MHIQFIRMMTSCLSLGLALIAGFATAAAAADWGGYGPPRIRTGPTVAVPVLILAVPILDMILITVLRIKEDKVKNFKQWIDFAGKDHFSHRLMRLGLGKRGAVFFLWGLQAAFCAAALAILPLKPLYGFLGLLLFFVSAAGVVVFFRKKRVILLRLYRR